MDGENNGNPYEQMDDLGGFPIFLEGHPYWIHPNPMNLEPLESFTVLGSRTDNTEGSSGAAWWPIAIHCWNSLGYVFGVKIT